MGQNIRYWILKILTVALFSSTLFIVQFNKIYAQSFNDSPNMGTILF
ncbi:hypothetical protein BH23THE1_BH23THE1_23970 [soil metagenome]